MEKLTFSEMMGRLYEAENDLIMLSDEEIKELLGDVKGKVDNLHAWITKLDAEEARLGGLIRQLQEKKKSVQNSRKKFKDYVAYTMVQNDTPKLFGQNWNLGCSNRKYVKAKDMEISTLDYATANDGQLKVIKREYSFDAKALAKAYKAQPEKYKKYIEEEVKPSIRFTVREED